MTNRELIGTYPFLLPRNLWTDEAVENYDYEFTRLDEMPAGWRKAFGEQMCAELKAVLSEEDLPDYRVLQIKEKFGELRWYSNWHTDAIYAVTDKYEKLSARTCIICGKPATRITTGWISPYCDECVGTKLSMPIDEWLAEWEMEE